MDVELAIRHRAFLLDSQQVYDEVHWEDMDHVLVVDYPEDDNMVEYNCD